MGITFTRKGYIQVVKDGVVLSSHIQEREAIESLSEREDGDYVIRYPDVAVSVILRKSDTTPPAVPSDFSATASTATTVTLTLTANVESDFSNYVLERSSDNIGWGYLKSFTGTSTTDTVDVSGSIYYYRVFSIDTRGNRSAYTAVKSAGPYTAEFGWLSNLFPVSIQRGSFVDLTPYINDPAGQLGNITSIGSALPTGVAISASPTWRLTSSTSASLGTSSGHQLRLVTSAEYDWNSRKSGALQSTDFRDSEVSLYTQGIATVPANVSRYSGDSVTGGKCLRIEIPASSGTDPGSWKCFLNSAWNGLNIGNPQTVGLNTSEFYVQYRIKFPSSWLVLASGSAGEGKKTSIISSNFNSNTAFEHVVQDLACRNIVQAYRQTDQIDDVYNSDNAQFEPFFERYGGSDFKLQPSVTTPFCLYSTGGSSYPNCYRFTPDTWMCIYQRVKVASYAGTTGNEYDLFVWKPGESGYTQLVGHRNYAVGAKGIYTNGFNGLWLLPYTSGRTSSSVSSYVLYDQVIISTSPIACPAV